MRWLTLLLVVVFSFGGGITADLLCRLKHAHELKEGTCVSQIIMGSFIGFSLSVALITLRHLWKKLVGNGKFVLPNHDPTLPLSDGRGKNDSKPGQKIK